MLFGNDVPIIRTGTSKKLYESYIKYNNLNETVNISSGSSVANSAPIGSSQVRRIKKTQISKSKSFKIFDSDLRIIESHFSEKQLLSNIGLICEATDVVYSIKDVSGNIKAAMSLKSNRNGYINEIQYIDTDEAGSNFKNGLVRLVTIPNYITFESENINVERNSIKPGYII